MKAIIRSISQEGHCQPLSQLRAPCMAHASSCSQPTLARRLYAPCNNETPVTQLRRDTGGGTGTCPPRQASLLSALHHGRGRRGSRPTGVSRQSCGAGAEPSAHLPQRKVPSIPSPSPSLSPHPLPLSLTRAGKKKRVSPEPNCHRGGIEARGRILNSCELNGLMGMVSGGRHISALKASNEWDLEGVSLISDWLAALMRWQRQSAPLLSHRVVSDTVASGVDRLGKHPGAPPLTPLSSKALEESSRSGGEDPATCGTGL